MTLMTPWGAALDPDSVLPEYPRPQLARDSYLNLNGYWQYAITSARRQQAPEEGDWTDTSWCRSRPRRPCPGWTGTSSRSSCSGTEGP